MIFGRTASLSLHMSQNAKIVILAKEIKRKIIEKKLKQQKIHIVQKYRSINSLWSTLQGLHANSKVIIQDREGVLLRLDGDETLPRVLL